MIINLSFETRFLLIGIGTLKMFFYLYCGRVGEIHDYQTDLLDSIHDLTTLEKKGTSTNTAKVSFLSLLVNFGIIVFLHHLFYLRQCHLNKLASFFCHLDMAYCYPRVVQFPGLEMLCGR